MEKQTVFIKRYPNKGELPKENEAYFITNLGRLKFDIYESVFRCPLLEDSYTEIEWWLQEIELPSEEEIEAGHGLTYQPHIVDFNNGYIEGFEDGADFVINYLFHTNEKGQEG